MLLLRGLFTTSPAYGCTYLLCASCGISSVCDFLPLRRIRPRLVRGSIGPDVFVLLFVCFCPPGSLAVNCTGLTQLNLSGCVGICGSGLAAVGECCPRLVHLDMSDCKQVRL